MASSLIIFNTTKPSNEIMSSNIENNANPKPRSSSAASTNSNSNGSVVTIISRNTSYDYNHPSLTMSSTASDPSIRAHAVFNHSEPVYQLPLINKFSSTTQINSEKTDESKVFISTQNFKLSNKAQTDPHRIKIKYNYINFQHTMEDVPDSLTSSPSTLSSPSSSPTNRSPPSSNSPQLSASIDKANCFAKSPTILEYPRVYDELNNSITPTQMLDTSVNKLTNNCSLKAKKKVSFNDTLVQVHLIPNSEMLRTNFIVENEANDEFYTAEESIQIKPSMINKSNSEQLVNDLRKNQRNHFTQQSPQQLQVVKLTVHSAKFNTNSEQPILSANQNFLSIVGKNNRVTNVLTNRGLNSQLFSNQRSLTSINLQDSQKEKSDEVMNFSYPKPPKYVTSALRTHSACLKAKPSLNTANHEEDKYVNIEQSPQLKFLSNLKKLRPSASFQSIDVNQSSSPSLNTVKNIPVRTGQPKFIFLKSDENLVREPSFSSRNQSNLHSSSANSLLNASPECQKTAQKSINLSSVNQLIALKDVNYYLTNHSSKISKQKHQISYSQTGNYANEVSKLKVKANGNVSNVSDEVESDFRRTRSALPVLRNNLRVSGFVRNGNGNGVNNSGNNISGELKQNQYVNINGVNNNAQTYKLVNSPILNTLTRAKTFLYNQNRTSTHAIEKRIRGSSIDKTSF